ncbi:MAG: hypothetical protein IT450_14810 [Phycisphaerales bacterium]|nr:hypothetical protein [Phycisphaerales bacterium]
MSTRVRGTVRGGVVVLPHDAHLEDGAEVFVEPVSPSATPKRGTAAALRNFSGTWAGEPEELERLIEEVQAMREEDLAMEIERDKRIEPL